MLRLRQRNTTPPGGVYFYRDPDTKALLTAGTMDALIEAVTAHRRTNQLALSPTLGADIEDWLCQQLSPKLSVLVNEKTEQARARKRVSFVTSINLTRVVLHQARALGPPVAAAEARLSACRGCPHNVQDAGCYSCYAIDHFNHVIGKWPEPPERMLGTCSLDNTFNRATIHMSTPQPFQQTSVVYPEYCWKFSPPPPSPFPFPSPSPPGSPISSSPQLEIS